MPWRIGNREFRPRTASVVITLVLLALFVSLAGWQLRRAEEKRVLLESFAAGSREGASVTAVEHAFEQFDRYTALGATGHYDGDHQFLLDNMMQDGRVGYRVLTPLRLADRSGAVLVDRGWIPAGATRQDIPDLTVDPDLRSVRGLMDRLPRAGIELGADPGATGWPRLVSFPRIEELDAALDYRLFGYILLLDAAEPDGYVRDWKPGFMTPETHIGYAIQWLGLGVALIVIFVLTNLRKPRSRQDGN